MFNIIDDLRPWVPEEVESFIQQHAERYQSICQECQPFFGNAFFGLQMKRELRIICG